MRSLSFRIFLFAFCVLLLPAAGQLNRSLGVNNTILSQIAQRMKHFVDEQTIAGAVTLVAYGSEVIEFDSLGMADMEAGHPMQKDTIFQIMSMTKPVTAIGIMMLAEEGSWPCVTRSRIIFRSFTANGSQRMLAQTRSASAYPTTPSLFGIF